MSATQTAARAMPRSPSRDASVRVGSRSVVRLICVGAYVATLHLVYVHWISPEFDYAGFVYYAPGVGDWLLAGSLIAVCALALPANVARPARFVSWWLFLTIAVPVTLVPLYLPDDAPLRSWAFAVAAGAVTTLFGRLDELPKLRRPNFHLSEQAFVGLLLGFTALVVIWTLVTVPVNIRFVWLADVREQRFAFSESVAGTSGLFGYAFRWQSAAVFPAMIAFGLDRSRHDLLAVAVVGQILLYGMTGFKQVLLSIVLVPLAYFVLRRPRLRSEPAVWLAGGLMVLTWVAALLDRVTHSIDFTSIFVRRAILVSGVYTTQYLSYFGENGFDLFSHSLLGGIVKSDYSAPPPQTIAEVFYGSTFSANANFLVDGYANLGYPGILIMACVVGGLLYLVESFTDNADVAATGAMLIVPTTSLANSAGFSTITTHGLGLALLFIVLYPRARVAHDSPSKGMVPPDGGDTGVLRADAAIRGVSAEDRR